MKCLGLAEQTGGKQSAWALTPQGRAETRSPEELAEAAKKAIREQEPRKIGGKAGGGTVPEDEPESSERAEQDHWRDELLGALLAMSPGAFENLCKRLLYATGIEDVEVKGGSGDKGIDGEGWLRTGLVRTKVVFQAKRWEGSVTPNIVREMRGSMPADAGHGIILTTARFTKGAKDDACSPQGATINLVDGAHLCELFLEHEIGVKTVTRQVVDHAALDEF